MKPTMMTSKMCFFSLPFHACTFWVIKHKKLKYHKPRPSIRYIDNKEEKVRRERKKRKKTLILNLTMALSLNIHLGNTNAIKKNWEF